MWARAERRLHMSCEASPRAHASDGEGFLTWSERGLHTTPRNDQCPIIWAFLLTVKRDTGGANNQVSEKLGS